MVDTISAESAENIRKRYNQVREWLATTNNPNCYSPDQMQAAGIIPPTNVEIGQLEIYDFMNNPPDKYFTYVLDKGACVGTYTHLPLSTRVSLGAKYRDNFGGTRQAIRFLGINGIEYVGTYYYSSGDFCRVRKAKRPIWGKK
jgi:hypothetical protein